ncbi:MAG TPA: SDR family oxidoreductase, partial [Hyphomicrobiales bacterium]|nr:SDR family oxidoreductase [Hyphomicrobiales bacterium]
FNNAGGPAPTGGIETIPAEGFDAAVAILLKSVMLGMKHVAPIMMKQQAGSIINNGSVAGLRAGLSSSLIYGAAKAAVIHLSKCVAMQLGEHNIRVNSISPGGIATGIFAKALGAGGDETAEKVKAGLAKLQPIPRAGLPDDIAQAAVFLASDESAFINGHDLVVDGGLIGGRQWSVQQQALEGLRSVLSS